jgi:large subunit ribosomal protein L19
MAISATHKETTFGVGDVIRVHQRLSEPGSDKSRVQIFEGTVIAIRGRDMGRSAIVRRIGTQNVGMELIFPLHSPTIEKVETTRLGMKGARHAKLYFIRHKSKREIEKIYSRIPGKDKAPVVKAKAATKKVATKKASK